MLRSALALLSSLQVGLRIRESIERSFRQAAVIAVALVILIIAALFGLFSVYQLLVTHYVRRRQRPASSPPLSSCCRC